MKKELTVHFKGIQAHAAGAAHLGHSALDAMLLTFQGINFLREHIPPGCQLDYTIIGSTGPVNIIHKSARARFVLNAPDMETLTMLNKRVFSIVKGATIMTKTKFTVE